MLRRFIKALEKVRKFNPRGPRYLPLEPDSEAEKVELRRQDMAERKGTEEWMLDYALRQVVSKLTPAKEGSITGVHWHWYRKHGRISCLPNSVGDCCKCAWWKEIRVSLFVPSRC
ncbi:hypothetical protein RYX36_036624 [Vicia faba]